MSQLVLTILDTELELDNVRGQERRREISRLSSIESRAIKAVERADALVVTNIEQIEGEILTLS